MLALQHLSPLARAATAALIYGLMVVGGTFFNGTGWDADATERLLFAVAAGFAFQQVTDGVILAKQDKPKSSPHAWMYGYVMGATWAVVIMLALWPTDADLFRFFVAWVIGGAAVSLLWIFGRQKSHDIASLAPHYDISKPQFERTFGGFFYFMMPFVTWGFGLLLANAAGDGAIDVTFFRYWLILMVAINYPYRPIGGIKRVFTTPLFVGLSLCFVIILLNYVSISSTSA
jgi:hypothetical protein